MPIDTRSHKPHQSEWLCDATANHVARNKNGTPEDNPVISGEPEDHAYNDPDLPPMEFLLSVMHDRRTPLAARIDAAKSVSVYMHPRLAQVTQEVSGGVTIKIEGGLPELPGTNIIMPHSANASSGSHVAQKKNGSSD